jgi:hypothetical protein
LKVFERITFKYPTGGFGRRFFIFTPPQMQKTREPDGSRV